jgi:hypothetical protein
LRFPVRGRSSRARAPWKVFGFGAETDHIQLLGTRRSSLTSIGCHVTLLKTIFSLLSLGSRERVRLRIARLCTRLVLRPGWPTERSNFDESTRFFAVTRRARLCSFCCFFLGFAAARAVFGAIIRDRIGRVGFRVFDRSVLRQFTKTSRSGSGIFSGISRGRCKPLFSHQ